MRQETPKAIEKLRLAIHGLSAPIACAGSFHPEKPVALVFKDEGRCEVIRAKSVYDQKDALQPLLEHCKPAPFGEGKKTRYDRKVRDALQLKAEKGGFRVENFDPESAGILQKIQRELVPHDPNPITAELYTVNVYLEGGHFVAHKDTPRGSDMFGTLVVCLPAQFTRGTLVVRHRGIVQNLDWGRAIELQKELNQLHWVAFFGDVDHEVEEVGRGVRVTLAYNLRRGEGVAPAATGTSADLAPAVHRTWLSLLADPAFLPNGGTLGYPCCHLYHQDAHFQQKLSPITQASVAMLKGRDHLAAATALQAGLKVTFHPYMFENCADETWQLDRFPTREERGRLGYQVDSTGLERALPIRASSEKEGDFGVTWIESPPSSDATTWREKSDDESELPAAARLHSCEYCPWGYFGNEGSEVDFYTYAALHIEIPPFGKGPRSATKLSKRAPGTGKRTKGKRQVDED